jgi:membrane-associated phospholipid phosphatase
MRSAFALRNTETGFGLGRLSRPLSRGIVFAVIVSSLCGHGQAQDFLTQGGATPAGSDLCDATHLIPCLKRIAQDEAGLTQSVFHIKRNTLPVILGVAAATGIALRYDAPMSKTFRELPIDPNQVAKVSDYAGVYAPFAVGGLLYLTGDALRNSHLAETGILATEAMVDAALMGKALKYVTNRQPPGNFPQSQQFYATGVPHGGSMPSSHALNVWAFARVVTGESHSKWVGLIAYSLATTVSFSRAATGAHSLSDVIVGSALGYGIGEFVLRRRSSDRTATFHRSIPRRGDPPVAMGREDELNSIAPGPRASQTVAQVTQPVDRVTQFTGPVAQSNVEPITHLTDDYTIVSDQ